MVGLWADKTQGFAESYMLEEVSCPDLTEFFKVKSRDSSCNASTAYKLHGFSFSTAPSYPMAPHSLPP